MKYPELAGLDLHGFKCFYKEVKKKSIIYHFVKEENFKYLHIKCFLADVDFCLTHQLSLK